MPKFKITYFVDAKDYYEAEAIASNRALRGCDFGISKTCGPRPRKQWFIQTDNNPVDRYKHTIYGTRVSAMYHVRAYQQIDKKCGHKHKYTLVEV